MAARQHMVGGVLLAASLGFIAFAAFSTSWWSPSMNDSSSGGVGFGLLGLREGTTTTSWADMTSVFDNPIPDFQSFLTMGRVSFGLLLLSCIAIAASVVRLFLGATHYSFVRYVVGVGAGMVMLHLIVRPEMLTKGTSFGLAFYLFWLGVIAAISGDVIVERGASVASSQYPRAAPAPVVRPRMIECPQCAVLFPEGSHACRNCGWSMMLEAPRVAAQPLPPSPLEAATRPCPACPQCRAPTMWMQEFERFLCTRCNVYV